MKRFFCLWLPAILLVSGCASAPSRPIALDEKTSNALRKAWDEDDPSYVRLMAHIGQDAHWRSESKGETLLHWAASSGKVNISRELIHRGADVNAENDIEYTPLHWAAYFGYTGVVRVLLEHKADPNRGGGISAVSGIPYKQTPLHNTMDKGRFEAAKLLIDHGADPTLEDYEGITPFYQALNEGRKEIAEYIIAHAIKVNVNEPNPTGFTPLMLATSAGYSNIAKELIRRGARVNVQGVREGNTPLHFAARRKDRELVEMLLAKGADATIKNKAGLTPLDEAEKANNTEIAEIIREVLNRRK